MAEANNESTKPRDEAVSDRFPAIDFHDYHRDVLPSLLAAEHGTRAAAATKKLSPIAFRLEDGSAFTYRPSVATIEILEGADQAQTVIDIDAQSWSGLVHELEAPAGLLYGGRIRCERGNGMDFMAWEAGLRAMYNGRAAYDPDHAPLLDRQGGPLDVTRTFALDDDPEDMTHFLETAGYLVVRDVFRAEELAAFLEEAEVLKSEAAKGDKLSWWAKNAAGEEILCRVTRANAKPALAKIPHDPRIERLKNLSPHELVHSRGEGEGVTLIWKHPDMVEGLSDIPWHRDCGMGGHAVICPTLIVSTYLTEARPETGELALLPGSHRVTLGTVAANGPTNKRAAHFVAAPGTVSLHYSDTMHVAPPPTDPNLAAHRISAIISFSPAGAAHHRGDGSYNDVLHSREDGQVEHLEKVAKRA